MSDERVKEYLTKGGGLYNVYGITTIRDGGTIQINTSRTDEVFGGEIFIHHIDKSFHNDYPLSDENKITDELSLEYLKERIAVYLDRQAQNLEMLKQKLKGIL